MERRIIEESVRSIRSWLVVYPNGDVILRLAKSTPNKHDSQRALARLIAERMPQYTVVMRGQFNKQTTIALKNHGKTQRYVASFTRLDIERSRED